MPVVSRFFGITITRYYNDHAPPHFHAAYQGSGVVVEIESGRVHGAAPRRALSLIEEWRVEHSAELMENWTRARARQRLEPITPLE